MADTKVSVLTAASALDGTEVVPGVQSATSKKITIDQIATRVGGLNRTNAAVVTPAAGFAADTLLAGSAIAIPAGALKAGTVYRCKFHVTKTAAGTATPIVNVRFGTGVIGDTARLTFTFAAGTAAIDSGWFEVNVTFNSVGSGTSAVIEGIIELRRATVTAAGLVVTTQANITIAPAASGGFDSTIANAVIHLSVNGGTSAAWTIRGVRAELDNLI